jgi:hypothetical protein
MSESVVIPKTQAARKRKLSRLDAQIVWLAVAPGRNGVHCITERMRLDNIRAAVRTAIKKYTGLGVGGSARRRTLRSPGSSPGAPTNQKERAL